MQFLPLYYTADATPTIHRSLPSKNDNFFRRVLLSGFNRN